MSEKLKPCANCGSTNVHSYNSKSAQYRQYSIKCKKCGMRVCKATLTEAIKVWNNRVDKDINVPVKVKYQHSVGDHGKVYEYGSCGTCGASVIKPDKFCSECGVKLDWSE